MPRYEFIVSAAEAGKRLDTFLASKAGFASRSKVAELVSDGAVLVDGEGRAKSFMLMEGQRVEADVSEVAPPLTLVPEHATLFIPFEDEWLLIVDKPAGMAVHPSAGHATGTLVHALLGHGVSGGESFRPGVVHRLDKDTSGLLVVAKKPEVHRHLVAMMREKAVERRYLALVHGAFAGDSGTVEAPIGRDPVHRKTMTIGGSGARDARTHFTVLERFAAFTLVEVRLDTGRTHQIRVHFLGIGHPVAGDPTYGRKDPLGVGRQFLHSARLRLEHPMTGDVLDVESPLAPDLAAVLSRLREETGKTPRS